MAPDSVDSCTEANVSVVGKEEEGARLIRRAQWLRAAILGANDGLLSTTSLMLGVGAARDNQRLMIISGVAGALAGACSMAVGEFVSVSTQRDIEQATFNMCRLEAEATDPPRLHSPQTVSPAAVAGDQCANAESVQDCDMYHRETLLPNPYKAAGASGLAFLCGSVVPLLAALVYNEKEVRVVVIVVVATVAMAVLGAVGARLGGLPAPVSATRVVIGGWLSMAVTYGVLKPFDSNRKGL